MVNITIPEMIINTTINEGGQLVCPTNMGLIQTYMSILTFAAVVYLAVVYKLHTYDRMDRDTFRKRVKDGVFVLIISSAWLFERAIQTLIWG